MSLKLNSKFNTFNDKDFDLLHYEIKLIKCPHCKYIGFLIFHGFIYGYKENSTLEKFIRARRLFCSNRDNRSGCGKTISIFVKYVLKHFSFSTSSLFAFLLNLLDNTNKLKAFDSANFSLSNSSIYRIYKRFYSRQSSIRSLLSSKFKPPINIIIINPSAETIAHLKSAFNSSNDPFHAFQYYFQTPLL